MLRKYYETEKGQEYLKKKWKKHNRKRKAAIEQSTKRRKLTERQWRIIQRAWGKSCAYCGASGVPLTKDHIIPVMRGGQDVKENVCPSCEPCNTKKGDSLDWAPRPPLRQPKF